ncbi:RnfH family protein [Niveibacterium terrae]|uniref:RnfH family protein n=1 Tax=Niveibacterium terrae TaxID=3373598 RepID=UPI003A8DFD85
MTETLAIEVVFAQMRHADIVRIKLPEGASVKEAVEASGLLQKHPEIDLDTGKFGVFGKLVKPDTVLRSGDRVEIYRPLIADPKEVRRRRAEEGKVMKKGGAEATP